MQPAVALQALWSEGCRRSRRYGWHHRPSALGLPDLRSIESTKSTRFISGSVPAASSHRQTCTAAHKQMTFDNSEKEKERKKKKEHPEYRKRVSRFLSSSRCLKILCSSDNSSIWWQWSVPWVLLSSVPSTRTSADPSPGVPAALAGAPGTRLPPASPCTAPRCLSCHTHKQAPADLSGLIRD